MKGLNYKLAIKTKVDDNPTKRKSYCLIDIFLLKENCKGV
jgi:hypothetical protein